MRFPPRTALFRLAAFAAVTFAALGCGGKADAPAAIDGDAEKQIAHLEEQLRTMEGQSAALRRDTLARLDEIDATRRAALDQIAKLRGKSAAAAPGSVPAKPEAKAKGGWALRVILLAIIIGAITFIMRIFLGRWSAEEESLTSRGTTVATVAESYGAGIDETARGEDEDDDEEPVIRLRPAPGAVKRTESDPDGDGRDDT